MSAVDLAGVVRPLEWVVFDDRLAKAQAWLQANYLIQRWSDGRYELCASYPGYGSSVDGADRFHPTMEAAQAAANADHAARVLAALDGELMSELVGALALADQSSRDLGWHRIYDATGPVLAKLGVLA